MGGGDGGGGGLRQGGVASAMSYAWVTIIETITLGLWVCSDNKKAFFYALIYHGPSQ